jgi:hypothetical protein
MHPPMVKEDPQQVQILIHQIEDFDLGRAVVVEAYPHLYSADASVSLRVMMVEDPHNHMFCGVSPVALVCAGSPSHLYNFSKVFSCLLVNFSG